MRDTVRFLSDRRADKPCRSPRRHFNDIRLHDLRGIVQHETDKVLVSPRDVDRSRASAPIEDGKGTAVVNVRVGDQDKVDFLRTYLLDDRVIDLIALDKVGTLVESVIENDPPVTRGELIDALGNFGCRSAETFDFDFAGLLFHMDSPFLKSGYSASGASAGIGTPTFSAATVFFSKYFVMSETA